MWELVVCAGISWAGCGAYFITPMPNDVTCYEALSHVTAYQNGNDKTGKNGRQSLAFCRPKTEEKK